ncbi:MAG: FeoB-associated Cys-rich membrane protein [Eubacteriales bacterium]
MNIYDYIILGIIGALAVVAIIFVYKRKKKGGGCSGSCSCCCNRDKHCRDYIPKDKRNPS